MDSIIYPLASLYEQLELELMLSIARRIKDYGDISGTIDWEMRMLAELGTLRPEWIESITKVLSGGDKELQGLLEKSAKLALDDVEPYLAKAHPDRQVVPPTMSLRVQEIYYRYYASASEKLNLTNTTMLSSAEQVYRDIINKTTLKVASGQTTRTQALSQTIKEFAEKGLPALVDKAGRKWSPEGYVNMVVRSTVNNVSRETRFARMDDWEEDLFYISQHSGARELCAPYQGMLVSKSDGNGVTEDLNGVKIRYIPFSSTSYGEPAGIFGINCGHYPIVFIPEVSAKIELMDMSDNERQYDESQLQRGRERNIRRIRRQIKIYEVAGDDKLLKEEKERLTKANAEMKAFLEKTGRTRRMDREQIHTAA